MDFFNTHWLLLPKSPLAWSMNEIEIFRQ